MFLSFSAKENAYVKQNNKMPITTKLNNHSGMFCMITSVKICSISNKIWMQFRSFLLIVLNTN